MKIKRMGVGARQLGGWNRMKSQGHMDIRKEETSAAVSGSR